MLGDLKHFVIFLHGLSGSGKGVIHKILVEEFKAKGYQAFYASSGDLFRAALSDPTIAAQMNQGLFINTLGAVIPGLEKLFAEFIREWDQSGCRRIIIIDGFIRRTNFVTESGEAIPSQLEQISEGVDHVLRQLASESAMFLNRFPEFQDKNADTLETIEETLRNATHILTSIAPQDAEAQIVFRSQKDFGSIRRQLHERVEAGRISSQQLQVLENGVDKLEAMLSGEPLDPKDYAAGVAVVKELQQTMAAQLGLKGSPPFSQIFESMGIATELRADDITAQGRKTRVANYIANYLTDGAKSGTAEPVWQPGFATEALTKDFKFAFRPDGTYVSEAENCIVIPNGKSRGIDLSAFQKLTADAVNKVVARTEQGRAAVCK